MTNKELYRETCTQQNDLPIFLKDWWLDIACKKWEAAIVKRGDDIAGVWPYPIEQKLGVTLLRTPVLTPYLGPHIFYPANLKQSKYDNYEREIISELLEQIPKVKVWFLALQPKLNQVGLFKQNGFDIQSRQTFLIDLVEDEETLFSKMHEGYRRKIRRSETEIQISNEPQLLPSLFNFQKAILGKKGKDLNFSLNYMQTLYNACDERKQTALWVAKKDNVLHAIQWLVWDKENAYYLMGGKNPDIHDNIAMTALMWELIRYSKSLGKKTFDFEGSMDAGVERFFSSFGGKREIYLELKKNKSLLWRSVQMIRKK